MPKSYWTKVQTPNGLKYFRADDVTDELLQKLKDVVNINKQSPNFNFSNISDLMSQGKRVVITWSGLGGTSYYDVSFVSSSSIKFVCVEDGKYRVLTLNSDNTSSAETHGISDNLAIFKAPLEGGSFSYPSISSVIDSYSEGKFVIIERVNGNTGTSSYMILTGCNESAGRVQFNGIGFKKNLLGIIQDNVDVWQDMDMFDDSLNSHSTNAVQNKVLHAVINDLQERTPGCFIEPAIFSGNNVPAFGSGLDIANIVDGHGVALIGLAAPSRMSVKTGDVYELMFNCYPYIGTYPVSLALFKLTGHPSSPSDDPSVTGALLKFRRLTSPIAPRELTGICNDFGIGANGNPSYAANPVRFTFEEDADFDAGDLIYVGMALAYNSAYQENVTIMASPLKAIYRYNVPSHIVMPAYYIFGTSDKIDNTGFSAKEFTAGRDGSGSGYDFSLSSGFGRTSNVLLVTSNGIVESTGSACPVQMKLSKNLSTQQGQQ